MNAKSSAVPPLLHAGAPRQARFRFRGCGGHSDARKGPNVTPTAVGTHYQRAAAPIGCKEVLDYVKRLEHGQRNVVLDCVHRLLSTRQPLPKRPSWSIRA
jgi:hypothetical protein